MIRIVRRKYIDGYYYVALNDDDKRVAWRRIRGNRLAKEQVIEAGKFKDKYKPLKVYSGKTKDGYESKIKPTPSKANISQVTGRFKIYDPKGRKLDKEYYGSETYTKQVSQKDLLEAMRYSALGQALAELGLIADSKSVRSAKGKASEYNAKLIPNTIRYVWYQDKKIYRRKKIVL